jgi:hypothetical protein
MWRRDSSRLLQPAAKTTLWRPRGGGAVSFEADRPVQGCFASKPSRRSRNDGMLSVQAPCGGDAVQMIR